MMHFEANLCVVPSWYEAGDFCMVLNSRLAGY
jgi:hypothetical protein